MELNDFKIFMSVAKNKSVSKAGEELGYAQSNISMRLKVLEDELGTTLLKRNRSGSSLTKDGDEFIVYASKMIELEKEIKAKFLNKNKEIVIAGSKMLLALFSVQIIKMFGKSKIRIVENFSSKELIINDECNCTVSYEKIKNKSIKTKQVFEEEIVLISSRNDINISDKKYLVASNKKCPYREFTYGYLEKYKIQEEKIMVCDNLESMISLIRNDMAVAFLPRRVAKENNLSFVNLEESDRFIKVYIQINKNIESLIEK